MKKTKINRLLKRTAAGILALAMISVPLPAQEMGLPDFGFGITVFADDKGNFGVNNSLLWSFFEENSLLDIDIKLTTSGGAMNSWTSASNVPWYTYRNSIESVKIHTKVTSIGNYAFAGYPKIKSVTLLKNVSGSSDITYIGTSAFEGCTSLTSINIPKGVKNIDDNAFAGCTSLESVTVPNTVTRLGTSVFEGCRSLESAELPDTLTSTGASTFNSCSNLKSIKIPSNVTSIESFFLSGCSSLTSITIPEKVKSIGNSAFCNCSGLTSITIPNSVTSVGNYAFKNCSGLETIFIPSSLNVSNADIPSTASQIRYTIGEDGKATVTDVTLGTGRTAVTIPDKIGNASVAVVYIMGSTTGITCPSAPLLTYSVNNSEATITKLVPPVGQTTVDLPDNIGGYQIVSVAAAYRQYVGNHTHNLDSNHICTLCGKTQYVKGITVSPDKQKLNVGGIVDLTANVDHDNAIDPSFTWTSSDTSVATVNENGTVKAVAPGTAVIRATANDGSGKYGKCEITVELSTVLSITETESGSEPVLSKDYTYDSINNVLTILSDKAMTISGTSTTDKIFVQKDISANITLNGVNIDVSGTVDACAFRIEDNSTGDVTITLKGTNVLKSANNCAGLQKNGISNSIGKLEIKGDGSLKVSGVAFAAGIGGDTKGSCSKVTISGGTITAIGCKYGYAAGIGGGKRGSTSDIKITGGSVKASVGCIPTNGTENVYPLTISNPDNKPVTINGKDYTPVNHRELDENDGNLYVFLPARTAENPNFVKVGDTTTKYVYDTEASKWYKIVDTITISIDAPTAGQVLDTSALASAANYTLGAVSWTDGDTTARFDKEYTAEIVVTADSNHTFGSSLTATVNGETASVTNNGNGTATVTFTFEKTAAAAVTGISINTPPTKTEYFVGEDIDLTGAKITATYEDGNSKPVDITSDMISGFDSSTAGTNTVTVTYEGKTTTFDVTIKEPAVKAIRISTTPKTEYLIDDTLDVSGGEITVSYEYGADKVISITSAMVTGFDSSAAVESQTLTVTYQEKTDTYVITVKKHTPTVTAPTASAITLGQTLAASTLSDSTWSWEDSDIQPTSAGTHSYKAVKTVSDADKYDYTALSGFTFDSTTNTLTTNVSVEVRRAGASVTPPTASNTLTYGQTLADAGLTAGWTWENASTVPDVNNAGFTAYKIVTDYDNFDYSNLTGFVYDETAHKISCTVAVTVNKATPTDATTASQSFTKGTASTVFAAPVFKGIDSAELTGSVSYTYGGQTYTTTAALTAALDLLDGGESGTISYTFTPTSANYTTASGSISFSVIDAVVTGITLKSAPTKTTYEIGDTLDLTGGKITVSYNNGTSVDIDITAEMISGFDSTAAGEKTVTVTYSGFTATFKVTVSKGSFTVEPTPGNIEGAEIDMPEEELNDAVLTPEDQELIEQGVDIAVLMTVITINPETVPANDVTAIENVMDDFDLGCYIDVSLLKRYSNGNPDVPVTDTNAPITISFKVPADILAQYPVSEYEYSVFCSHNGVGYPITCSYNAATNVMSFSSTMFSTYALAVKSRTPAAVDYTITADSHVTVQSTAQAGETVIVTVEDGYKATVTNALGAVITTITGTGSFVMPESNVTITSELINTHVHDYSTEWKTDSTSHWYECECGDRVNVAAHVSNGGIVTVRPTETTEGVRTYSCSICGYVMSTETIPMLTPDHSHSYGTQWKSDSTSHWHECECGEKADIAAHISDNGVVTLQPTETSEGIMTYSCTICDYILRTETIPANTPVHTHNYGTAWYYDSSCHWHECSCGDRSNIGQHISNGGIVTVQPTATSTGLRVYSCSVCGYVLRTETIPATGFNGYPSYPTYPNYVPPVITTPSVFTAAPEVEAEVNGSTVTLKWNEIKNANKYYVYQYKDGKYVRVKTTTDTSVTFKNLKNGETYKFLVRYTINGKLSPTSYSGKITVKVYYKPLPKPTATKNSIKLTWEAVPEAEKYAIYKYVDGKAVKLTETKKLSVKIGKLIPDTEYKYIVRACVDGKWTTMLKSDIVTVKTTAE